MKLTKRIGISKHNRNIEYWYLTKEEAFCTFDGFSNVVTITDKALLVVGESVDKHGTPYFLVGKHEKYAIENIREARKLIKQLEQDRSKVDLK